jgi:tetratricopeptide (TPR) repeat protein
VNTSDSHQHKSDEFFPSPHAIAPFNTILARPDRHASRIPFLVFLAYVALLCNSVATELFWSDDPEEMDFVCSCPFVQLLFGHDAFGYFRPIKNILWFVFSRLEALGIEWCHILAIAIGIVSFFPVLSLCRRILENEWKALAAAVVWLLAPTLVSSVAWLSCVNIQIMVAFASASIVFHDKAWDRAAFRRSQVAFASVFLFLALLSYECAVALGPILIAFDWILRPDRLRDRNARIAHVCYWVTIGIYAVFRFLVGAIEKMSPRWIEATRAQLVLSSPFFTARHFADWLWPFGRFSVGGSYVWGEVSPFVLAGCAASGFAVLVFALFSRKRFPALSFCLIFAILAFAPVSNCLGFGNGPYGDYYLSLASIGLAAGSVEIVWRLVQIRGLLRLPALALAAAFVLVRVAAIPEAAHWARLWSRTDLAYAEAARNHPESIQNQLGALRCLVLKGDWDKALNLGRRIETRVGADSSFMAFVYSSRAIHAIVVEKNKDAAKDNLSLYDKVSNETETEKEIGFYEGLIAETIDGDLDAAEQKFRDALAGSQDRDHVVRCIKALARIEKNRGEWTKVVDLLEQAARISPKDSSLQMDLADAFREAGENGKVEGP